MKRIVCEMCGSTNLIKQNGVFVCQECGTQYSVEEARKMMVEGTVDVKGTVKVDRSSEVDNILKNADTTYSDGNYKEAFDLYSQAMNIDPDNPHAILYRAISSAWQSSVKDCKITEINHASKRAFELQHQLYGDSKEYFDFCYDATLKIAPLINAIAQMYINYYNRAKPRNISITGAIATSGISAQVKNTMELGTKNSCVVSANVITYVLDGVEDFSESSEGLWTVLHNMAHNCIIYRKNARMTMDPSAVALEKMVDELKEKYLKDVEAKKSAKREAYWAEHIEEKNDLEAKKSDAYKKKNEFEIEIDNIPELTQKTDTETKIRDLTTQMNNLGMFKGKEKKALQAQIDNVNKSLVQIEKNLEEKKSEIQKKIDEQAKIIAEIEIELNKDR